MWGIAGQEATFFSSLQLPSGGALCFVVQPAAALLPYVRPNQSLLSIDRKEGGLLCSIF